MTGVVRISVRVKPRSRRPGLEMEAGVVVARVREAPEGGRATEEARRTLARGLEIPAGRVRLASGAASRTKIFEVQGLSREEVVSRLLNG